MLSRKLIVMVTSCVVFVSLVALSVTVTQSEEGPSASISAEKPQATSLFTGSQSSQRIVDVETTLASFQSSDPKIRRQAASDDAKLGPAAKKAIPALIVMLAEEDESVQEAAATALAKMGSNAKEALPQLITVLGSGPPVRSAAIAAITAIGPEAKSAAPALGKLLKNTNDDVALQAAVALHALAEQEQACRTELIRLLESKEPYVRTGAARELGTYRQLAKESVPALLSVLKDQTARGYVREAAVQALGEINPGDPEVKDALVTALNDKRRSVQEAAKAALKKIR